MKTPDGFEKWNPAMRGAYRKGYEASAAGNPPGACPYDDDKRTASGRLTWSRAFSSAWHDGWNAHREDEPISAFYNDCTPPAVAIAMATRAGRGPFAPLSQTAHDVICYWSREFRSWVAYCRDASGNQIGAAEYFANKSAIFACLK